MSNIRTYTTAFLDAIAHLSTNNQGEVIQLLSNNLEWQDLTFDTYTTMGHFIELLNALDIKFSPDVKDKKMYICLANYTVQPELLELYKFLYDMKGI